MIIELFIIDKIDKIDLIAMRSWTVSHDPGTGRLDAVRAQLRLIGALAVAVRQNPRILRDLVAGLLGRFATNKPAPNAAATPDTGASHSGPVSPAD
jgi:hypothetical protein